MSFYLHISLPCGFPNPFCSKYVGRQSSYEFLINSFVGFMSNTKFKSWKFWCLRSCMSKKKKKKANKVWKQSWRDIESWFSSYECNIHWQIPPLFLLLIAICCKGNVPHKTPLTSQGDVATNHTRTPTPIETTIIVLFKPCIFVIAPFQSLMEATEEPRRNTVSLMGGRPRAACATVGGWAFPATYEPSTVCICLPAGNKFPGKRRGWRPGGLRAVRRTWQKACDCAPMRRNWDAINLLLYVVSRRWKEQLLLSVRLFFFFLALRHEHPWRKDHKW